MTPVRLLIVEDDPQLMAAIEAQYREQFKRRGLELAIDRADTVESARSLGKKAQSAPYDLVSLDINLGDTSLTGLDVLDTFNRRQSAWMVAMLTGLETDTTLDDTLGITKADELRRRLRRDAYTRFPPDRLLVVEKPPSTINPADARTLLTNRIEQIVSVYEEIGRQRYIFRPIEVTSLARVSKPKGSKEPRKFIETIALHWQIRFNCGEIRTLPDLSGFKTLHYLISQTDRNVSLTPEEAMAIEPKMEKSGTQADSSVDPVAEYFTAQGIKWNELSGTEQEQIIRAALSLKFNRYCELRGYQDDDDLSVDEESELQRIIRELGPLEDTAEVGYKRMNPTESDPKDQSEPTPGSLAQDGLHNHGGNYDKLGENRRGKDSPPAALFRKRMNRVKDCLRENGFANLAQHLEDYIMPNNASWSYNPPEGVSWTS